MVVTHSIGRVVRRASQISAIVLVAVTTSACTPYPFEQPIEPAYGPNCDGPQLTGPAIASAGDSVSVGLDPETCDLDEAYYGEIIVRGTREVTTGVEVDAETSFPLDVALPADLRPGPVLVMLARPCNDVGTADCHFPFFELTIR
jgi:hypothetical protein